MKYWVAKILVLFLAPNHSTLADGDTITMGYGPMDENGNFKHAIPSRLIKEILGASKWSEIQL